jgi:hypothetical protein
VSSQPNPWKWALIGVGVWFLGGIVLGALMLSAGYSSAGSGVVSGIAGIVVGMAGYNRERFRCLERQADELTKRR